MEFAMASAIGVLTAVGVYLILRARTFDMILGMTFLSYATNLLIFSSGRLAQGKPPVLREGLIVPIIDRISMAPPNTVRYTPISKPSALASDSSPISGRCRST